MDPMEMIFIRIENNCFGLYNKQPEWRDFKKSWLKSQISTKMAFKECFLSLTVCDFRKGLGVKLCCWRRHSIAYHTFIVISFT